MKILLLTWLLALPGGDREQGLQLYREGRYAEAAAAFQRAVQSDGDSPELQWNLALAHWHAGDLLAAETAAEKYAATSPAVQVELHRGLLGAIRHQEALAKVAEADQAQAAAAAPPTAAPPTAASGAAAPAPADPLPLLQAALAKANQARDHFVRGAKAAATPELRRNIERTLRLIDELKRRIEELEKQRQPSEDKDQQDSKKEEKPDESKQDDQKPEQKPAEEKPSDDKEQPKPDEPKDGEKKPQDGKQNGEQKPDDGKQSGEQAKDQGQPQAGQDPAEPKPEPADGKDADGKAGDEPKPQPKPGESGEGADGAPEPVPGADDKDTKPRQDAPGEQREARELSPEQTQRLLERLQGLDGKQKAIRARAKSSRRPVERDW